MRRFRWGVRALWGILLVGTVGMVAFLARYILSTPQPLESTLPGDARIYRWVHGHIFYRVCGPTDAAPLLLVHAPGIGASSHEMRTIMEGLARQYRVYALDLLGFGLSDRPRMAYTAQTYVSLLRDFLRSVVARPAVLVASGLSCNYAVAVAASEPDVCTRLVFLSPDALSEQRRQPPWLAHIWTFPVIGFMLYAVLTSRSVLRWFSASQRQLPYRQVPAAEVTYMFAAAHQLGAQNAVRALLAGNLDMSVQELLPRLQQPLLVMLSARALSYERPAVDRSITAPRATVALVPDAGQLIHEDRPELVVPQIVRWQGSEEETSSGQEEPASLAVAEPSDTTDSVPVQENVRGAVEAVEGQEQEHEPALQPETAESSLSVSEEEAYCMKCRQKRIMQGARKIVTKNGRSAIEGTCPVCTTRLFRFIAG